MSMTVAKHLFVHVSSELQVQENNHLKKRELESQLQRKKKRGMKMGLSWWMFAPEAP